MGKSREAGASGFGRLPPHRFQHRLRCPVRHRLAGTGFFGRRVGREGARAKHARFPAPPARRTLGNLLLEMDRPPASLTTVSYHPHLLSRQYTPTHHTAPAPTSHPDILLSSSLAHITRPTLTYTTHTRS